MFLKRFLYNLLPTPLKNGINNLHLKDFIQQLGKEKRETAVIERLKKQEEIHVVFIAMSVAFWKYDELFKLMLQHKKFKPIVLLQPRITDLKETQNVHIEQMEKFFKERNFPYVKDFKSIKSDIVFYAQPYKNSVPECLRPYNLKDKLTCYVPYAFFISNYSWAYNSMLHKLAWKCFYPTELHKINAKEICYNQGKNVEIVGYSLYDQFKTEVKTDPWRSKDKKRIIWAVHHSILNDDLAECSTFLKYAEFMKTFAIENQNLEIAFKPHPHLKEHLYKHEDWGKEKTDAYFDFWKNSSNTFFAEGNYIDLFKTSDAMIHDCGSFTVEYLYVNKPILYIGNERDKILCNFGKMAMEANYTLNDFSIEEFIDTLHIDKKNQVRTEFLQKYLIPPNNKTFSQNILDLLEGYLK